ncbi:MAG TPA: FkbM family methyltransferase [Bacteroidia bacterium]|nr:FkbM family methyltransferase [Bacteroidia bacterium]
MVKNSSRILFEIFREKIRRFVHPKIYQHNKTVFLERKKFYASFLSANDLVFDVGANLGNRVEVFLSLKNKVIAVEPQSYCAAFLRTKFSNNITLLKIALGAKKDKMTMYINAGSSTISSLSKEWIDSVKNSRFKDQQWNETEEVEVDTLDNLIAKYGVPGFIKIDVEGFEADVLKGLSSPVPMLSFEYTTPEQENKLYECLGILHKLHPGYLCNYSAGEKNSFVLPEWLNVTDFKNKLSANIHALEGFGDIYVKLPGHG